ncbi:hypothetical protein ACFXC8_29290 [Streptomyces sp. NPDC059441]|uniref:hypothetical protein n=1 Tax=Streptomyces sp. NPDC059441 TaxID=3346829 RepID=UPI0036C4FB80
MIGASPAFAADATKTAEVGKWNPDPTSLQFTVAVMPDTQFLYWGSQDSVNRTPQEESFRYIINNSTTRRSSAAVARPGPPASMARTPTRTSRWPSSPSRTTAASRSSTTTR